MTSKPEDVKARYEEEVGGILRSLTERVNEIVNNPETFEVFVRYLGGVIVTSVLLEDSKVFSEEYAKYMDSERTEKDEAELAAFLKEFTMHDRIIDSIRKELENRDGIVNTVTKMLKRTSHSNATKVQLRPPISELLSPNGIIPRRVFMPKRLEQYASAKWDRGFPVNINPNRQKEVLHYVSVAFDQDKNVKINSDIWCNPYGRAAHDVCISFYDHQGESYFTLTQIYRALTGNKSTHPKDEALQELREIIHQLSITKAKIKIDSPQKWEIERYLLPVDRVRGIVKGQEIEVYRFLAAPPLLAYGQVTKQILTIPIKALNSSSHMSKEDTVISLYLMRRLSTHKMRKSFVYETMYDDFGLTEENFPEAGLLRVKRHRFRQKVKEILTTWAKNEVQTMNDDKSMKITGFEPKYEGAKEVGFDVILAKTR